jgi:outer membrane protein OmpA-like peptidoglycan-associated protein
MPRQDVTRFLIPILLLAVSLGATSCATGSKLRGQAEEIKELTDRIHEPAKRCAPKRLAVAEASVEFGLYELEQGNFVRAREHLDLAEGHAREAEKLSQFEECEIQTVTARTETAETKTVEDVEPTPQDRDGDGLVDEKDECPDDPEDFDGYQDEDGCPEEDNDGDGIVDDDDACPDVAEDLDDFQDRDGCPEFDNDGDGLTDQNDGCPLEAEDFDGYQDEDGCADSDNDEDDIADLLDHCPLEKEKVNGYEDDDGCPDKKPLAEIKGDRIELGQKVYFKYDKSDVLPRSYPLLNDVAKILKDNPKLEIRIEGHTDDRGSARYNKKLSQRRAESVRAYLSNQGVSNNRMDAKGFGESTPIEDNNTDAGRAANRRVEIHITKK